MAETSSIASVTSRIDSQEIRIYQHDTQEMRKQYEDARRREAEASRMLEVEKQRCRNQEAEIERRRQQLEESSEFIRRLQGELEDARRTASGVRRELRENEIKSILDAEIMHFKTQIIRLEAKLQQKETDLEAVREFWKEHSLQLERKVESLKAELALKEKMYNEIVHELQNSPVSVENNKFKEKVDQLNQRIGSLAAINENLQDKINGMLAEKFELENKVRYANEDKSTLQSQINSLKAQLSNSEGTNQLTNCKLSDEIDKIKHQKAQLRYEHLQLKRNFSQLEKDNKALRDQIEQMKNSMAEAQKSYENLMNEKTAVINEKSDLFNQIASLKDELSIQQKKAEDAERLLRENEICEQAATHQLKAELQKAQDSRKELTEALVALDAESERMLSKLRVVNQEKKNAVQESSRLKKELDELRSEAMTQCRLKNDLDMAREENSRLILRIKYLENELNESRTEHRAELDRLAEKIIAATSTTANAGDCALQGEVSRISLRNLNVDDLQNRLKQQESQNRYWQRSVEQSKKELESVNNEISELRKRQCELINDNTVLRQALAEAVKKGELYRDENAELKKSTDDVDRYQQKIQQLEEELYDVRGEIAQKEKLIAYLQSNQQPKQMRKLKASSFSTLISASNDSTSVSDFELETQECDQLQKKRDWLRQNLEQQRRVLTDKQNRMLTTNGMNEAIPLLKPNTPMPARRVQSPRNVEKPANQQLQKVFHSPAVIINNKWVKFKRCLAHIF